MPSCSNNVDVANLSAYLGTRPSTSQFRHRSPRCYTSSSFRIRYHTMIHSQLQVLHFPPDSPDVDISIHAPALSLYSLPYIVHPHISSGLFLLYRRLSLHLINTRLPIQKAALLHRAPCCNRSQWRAEHRLLTATNARADGPMSAILCRRARVRDVFGDGVFAADLGGADVLGFAGFGEGVVAGVEVFALLQGGEGVSAVCDVEERGVLDWDG